MAYNVKDFSDIVSMVMEELKLDSNDTAEEARIKRDVNAFYLDEVVPFKRWKWLFGETNIRHAPYVGDGTVSVTPNSATITFSVAPSTSKTGYLFSVDNFEEVYTISAHTAGATTATLTTIYTGTLNATASYKVWTNKVALPTDLREIVEVRHDFYSEPLEGRGLQDFRRINAESPKLNGRPQYFTSYDFEDPTTGTAETESDRYRLLLLYPAIDQYATTLHIDYIKEATVLDLDADEPLMPIEDRIVLVYGALSRAWRRARNPEEAATNQALFDRKLSLMAGRVEDATDKPQVTLDSRYIARKRGKGIRSSRMSAFTGGSSYAAPSYLANVTINGATITGNVTVSSGITIDGRDISVDGATLDAHIAASSGAHAASAISSTPSGNLAASTVQAALNELQTDIDTRALDADLDAHTGSSSGAHAATAISNTPSGNLAAVTVQAALNELQGDINTINSDLTTHTSDTSVHGVTGNVVGTTDTQTLSAKSFSSDVNFTAAGLGISIAGVDFLVQPNADDKSIAIGTSALSSMSSTNQYNVAIGNIAGAAVTSGVQNVGVGYGAINGVTTSSNNTAIGFRTMYLTNGNGNVAIGSEALHLGGDTQNVAVGMYAMHDSASMAAANTALGFRSLYNHTGSQSTAVGAWTLYNATGSNNTALGYSVGGTTLTTGTNNILIGTSAAVDTVASNSVNTLNVGNTLFGTSVGTGTVASPAGRIGILNTAPATALDVTGTITASQIIDSGLTASRVVVSDGSKQLSSSSVTSTTLAFLDATSSVQTQLDAKIAKSLVTTKGDLIVATASATPARLPVGSDGLALVADSAEAAGVKWASVMTNPMTTGGDIIYGGASGVATRLANGSAGQFLKSAGSTSAPVWTSFPTSIIQVTTPTGHGSTNTKIRKFSVTQINSGGSDITYTASATNGDSFTINTTGVYAIIYTDYGSAAASLGISNGSGALTTSIGSIAAANRLAASQTGAATQATAVYVGPLLATDVIRAHTDGSVDGGSATNFFTIARIS